MQNEEREKKNTGARKGQREIKMGTWNVRSTREKEDEPVEEMISQKIEILGIAET